MPKVLEDVTRDAMELPAEHQMALANFLLERSGGVSDAAVEAAWEAELCDRIREVEEGREIGVPYEEVMRSAERLLAR